MTNKNKILVTGADGFIGSHLVERLIKNGSNVKAFCVYNPRGSYGWLDTLPKSIKDEIDFVLGDIRDPLCVKDSMIDCNKVFHLAALIGIPYSYVAPSSYIDTNIHGTLNVVQAARELEVEKVVHTSTSEVYGTAQFVPISESHPLVAQSPYAATKIAADQLALSYWRSFGTPVTVLRPFNTYGPRQSNRAVIPSIITQINSGNNKIKLGNTNPTRDFNFVSDTCEAFIAVANSNKTLGQVINSASKFEISIAETAKFIAEIMGKEIEIVSEKNRFRPELSEVNRLYGDNSLLKEITDWNPRFDGLEGFKNGLEITCQWFKNDKNISIYRSENYSI
tara:strand:- start:6209 stop:7216 length:1008 start_codon:yes stop_codon:yes gene_type:complete